MNSKGAFIHCVAIELIAKRGLAGDSIVGFREYLPMVTGRFSVWRLRIAALEQARKLQEYNCIVEGGEL